MINITRRNNVTITGKGTLPIIFAHGFGCSQHTWSGITPGFINDYKIVLFDYVGAGQSDMPLANILGLVNLIEDTDMNENGKELFSLLRKSVKQLDETVKNIVNKTYTN